MAVQEDSEIDEWFNEQKDLLSERMYDELQKGVAFEKAQTRFDTDFKRLLGQYNERYRTAMSTNVRSERLGRPFRRFHAWREERALKRSLWWKEQSERWRRWRFERKYRKLFKK
jgi:hypothetical protein